MREAIFHAEIGKVQSALTHPRFGIYRSNVNAALIGALKVRYPVVEQLVGKEFFSAMAAEYVALTKPASPVLIAYGESFPDFVHRFKPAQSLPYLGEVAALESLWWQSYHAADIPPLSANVLHGLEPDHWQRTRFKFLPYAAVFHSSFSAVAIWSAHQTPAVSMPSNLAIPEHALVHRSDFDVVVRNLQADHHVFYAGLFAGETMAQAFEMARSNNQQFDLTQALQVLFSISIIKGIDT